MPKIILCSKCKKQLEITRKAVQGQVFDMIEPHECTEEVDIPELNKIIVKGSDISNMPPEDGGESIFKKLLRQKLTKESNKPLTSEAPPGLRDRVFEQTTGMPSKGAEGRELVIDNSEMNIDNSEMEG